MRDFDYSDATDFLSRFYEGTEHAVELRALANDGDLRPVSNPTRDPDIVESFCVRYDGPGRGIFFGVATRITGNAGGTRQDLAELPGLWVDIDCYKIGVSVEEAVRALGACPLIPTVIVGSGGGVHAYWLFREPLDARWINNADSLKEEIDAALRQLAGVFAGDTSSCDITRVLRLPGTHNTKTGELRPVAVLEASWVRHEFADLVEMLDWLGPLLRSSAPATADAEDATNPFLEAAKHFAFGSAIDVQQRLEAMQYQADGPTGINATQRDVSASMVGRGHADDEIVELLLATTRRAAFPHGEKWNWKREERKIRLLISEWRKKLEKLNADRPSPPSPVIQLKRGGPEPVEEASADAEDAPQLSGFPLNDIGNANRLILHHGAALRFVIGIGWHTWDGRRYEFDPAIVAARKLAHETVRTMTLQALDIRAASEKQAKSKTQLIKFAIGSGNTSKINGMLTQAEPHLAATADLLDADPWMLNCLNGTVDLRTLELRPHTQSDLLTKLVPIAYDPVAACPIWERFVSEIFGGDAQMVDFLQRSLGYSLTGITTEQLVFILHGSGSNGKSVLLETIAAVLSDYAQQCPSDTFVSNDKGSHIPNDIARLVGSRFVSIVETEQDRKLAEGLVKQATGGDRLVARFLHKEWFEFTPKFKLWMATNHKPRVRGNDNAIWRRLRLLPFLITFADPEEAKDDQPIKDRGLKNKLMNELPGILNWMIRGCIMWQNEGLLQAPKAVLEATTEYRESQDVASGFVWDACHVHVSAQCAVAELYKAYKKWCDDNGETPVSAKALGTALDEKGFRPDKGSAGKRMRKGLDLKSEWRQSLAFEDGGR